VNPTPPAPAILVVEDLSIDARTPEGLRPVLEGVSFIWGQAKRSAWRANRDQENR
jgi:hypothetical protein